MGWWVGCQRGSAVGLVQNGQGQGGQLPKGAKSCSGQGWLTDDCVADGGDTLCKSWFVRASSFRISVDMNRHWSLMRLCALLVETEERKCVILSGVGVVWRVHM